MSFSGETTRKGFYLYDDRRKAKPDPEIKNYIEKARNMAGVSIDPKVCGFVTGNKAPYSSLCLQLSYDVCFGLHEVGKIIRKGHNRDDILPCRE